MRLVNHEIHAHAAGHILGCQEEAVQRKFCLLGVPLDITVCFRPGTRRGPQAIRQASWVLEEFSLYQGRSLDEIKFCDLGDLALPQGALNASLTAIKAAASDLLASGYKPFILGGEHLLTLPTVDAAAQVYSPDLVVLQFDAHADLRAQYEGETLSHATVMRQLANIVPPDNIYQFGIRSATAKELAYARAHTNLFPRRVLPPLAQVRPRLLERPVYVTIDIDVFDPAFAPGVGTPEPGGQSVETMLQALNLLKGLDIVGADIVEVCPPFDQSERTAALAALLVRELLLYWS